MHVQNDTSDDVEYQVGMTGCRHLAVGQREENNEISDPTLPESDRIRVFRRGECDQGEVIGCCKVSKAVRGTVIHIRGSQTNIRFRASNPNVNLLGCP